MMPIATVNHIDVDDHGVARIAGTRIKVVHLVMEKMANGWGAEELNQQFPNLTLAQIHCAFAYYYDNQEQLDLQIRESLRAAEKYDKTAKTSEVANILRIRGLLG